MNWPFPIVDKIRWVYPPPSPSTAMPNNLADDKFKEIDEAAFSQIHAQKYAALNNMKLIWYETLLFGNNSYLIFTHLCYVLSFFQIM